MPNPSRRTRALVALGITAALTMTACGSDDGSDAAASDDGTTKVNMAFEWTCEGSWAPIYSGIDQGIFKDNGIDLTYDRGQGGSDTVPLVATGEFDVAQLSAPPVVIGAGEQLPITVFGVASTEGPVTILADPSIKTPADLEGKTLAVQTDQFEGAVWDAYAEANGLSDVDVVPSDDASQAEFLNGDIDAFVIFYNTASTKAILDERPDVTVMKMQDTVPTYGHTFVANNDWLGDHGDTAKAFMTAWAESTKWVLDNKDAALATLTKECAEVDPEALSFSLDAYLANYTAAYSTENGLGSFSLDGLEATQKVLVDAGLAEEVPVSDFATTDDLPDPAVTP